MTGAKAKWDTKYLRLNNESSVTGMKTDLATRQRVLHFRSGFLRPLVVGEDGLGLGLALVRLVRLTDLLVDVVAL